jgi:hypothetical protein
MSAAHFGYELGIKYHTKIRATARDTEVLIDFEMCFSESDGTVTFSLTKAKR